MVSPGNGGVHDGVHDRVEDAVATAVARHQQGALEQARQAYLDILAADPGHADVLNYLGMLEFQSGNSDRGIELAESSLRHDPGHASACNNLANMYLTTFRVEDAEQSYRRSMEMDPAAVQPLHNMGVIEKARRNHAAAEDYFLRVLALDPRYLASMSALAGLYTKLGKLEPAFALLKSRLDCETSTEGQKDTLLALARICLTLDKKAEAVDIYEQWLQLFPGDPTATHMLAAVSGDRVPEKPDGQYIKSLFDRFSSTFDNVLQDLDYQAPQHIKAMVEALHESTTPGTLRIVDAGCGTGLCGGFLKPLASQLAGVDLSSGMLGRARFRQVYDELVEQDLTEYLQQRPGDVDLLVSADTLCYFGALEGFLQSSWLALTPGGYLIFTLERYDEAVSSGYHLEPHGRYSHTLSYVEETIRNAGLALEAVHECDLRLEKKEPVKGYLVVAGKPFQA